MSVANGFPQISGIFFCVFDLKQGSKPLCQVPDGSIELTPTSEVGEPLIPFDAVKNYIIPKPTLCNRLISIQVNDKRVIGHPVHLIGDHYKRNSFTFNLAFIFPASADTSPYEGVISRTAKMLRALEEQNRFLSDFTNIAALDGAVEQMFQDLNSFSECQIPIDASNKLDIKLFPVIEAPPMLKGHDVPIFTVKSSSLVDETWDPTLERLLPYINGANSIRRISDLASADFKLTIKAIQHLVHYGCVVILGIFQFSNVYAPTSSLADICDPHIFQEFCNYVYKYKHSSDFTLGSPNSIHSSVQGSAVGSIGGSTTGSTGSNRLYRSRHNIGVSHTVVGPASVLSLKQVFNLYSSFHIGLPLNQWCLNNKDLLQDIDLNRFISFGLLKQIIYRTHEYPLPLLLKNKPTMMQIEKVLEEHGVESVNMDLIANCFERPVHLDELCNELRQNRIVVTKILKSLGDWALVNV